MNWSGKGAVLSAVIAVLLVAACVVWMASGPAGSRRLKLEDGAFSVSTTKQTEHLSVLTVHMCIDRPGPERDDDDALCTVG
jgi:predicted small integral membrane protein